MKPTVMRVFRWAPGTRERMDAFEVTPREGLTVLDALVEIQRGSDPTLAFRYACRVGMCGSCAMVIDGRERWACRTLVARLGSTVTVRPLYHFPLIRDLVVDMTPFTARMRLAGAAFAASDTAVPAFAAAGRDSLERRAIDAAVECIGCGMCLSACTMVGHNPRFPGPAALNRAFTLQMDSRDDAHGARAALLLSEDALVRCHAQSNCTTVCPMGLAPTESILALRRRAALGLVGVSDGRG